MTPVELSLEIKPLAKKYEELFGEIPCYNDYACTYEAYFIVLTKSIEEHKELKKYITKRKLEYKGYHIKKMIDNDWYACYVATSEDNKYKTLFSRSWNETSLILSIVKNDAYKALEELKGKIDKEKDTK